MATLIQLYNARHSNELRSLTESAILRASKAIQIESAGTAYHAERLACANSCLRDDSYLNQITNAMMFETGTNDTIASNLTAVNDNDVQWVVDTAFTGVALQNPPA